MPESFTSPLDDRNSALENFVENTGTQCAHLHGLRTPSSIRHSYSRSLPAIADGDRLKAAIRTPKVQDVDPPFPTTDGDGRKTKQCGKRARAKSEGSEEPQRQSSSTRKGSSVHYGVRFRSDLRKWVAEIRVAEWKDVDKKVWLGTFDTEDAAARGVDLARKLLNCTKKRPPNLPCKELDLYSTKIPTHLDLTDIANEGMFKEVVPFIKNECQAYAASFPPTTTTPATPIPQPHSVVNPNILGRGYEGVDVLYWNDDDNELGQCSDSEFGIPEQGPELHTQLPCNDEMEALNIDDFMEEIFEEAFHNPFAEFDSSSPGSSAPSSFTPQPLQWQFRDEVARGASPERQQGAREMRRSQEEMELLQLDPVCHVSAAEYRPHTWPGPATQLTGFFPAINSGLQSEQSPLHIPPCNTGDMTFFDFANHWSLQAGDQYYQFQMDLD